MRKTGKTGIFRNRLWNFEPPKFPYAFVKFRSKKYKFRTWNLGWFFKKYEKSHFLWSQINLDHFWWTFWSRSDLAGEGMVLPAYGSQFKLDLRPNWGEISFLKVDLAIFGSFLTIFRENWTKMVKKHGYGAQFFEDFWWQTKSGPDFGPGFGVVLWVAFFNDLKSRKSTGFGSLWTWFWTILGHFLVQNGATA